jgi:hypothetical protein
LIYFKKRETPSRCWPVLATNSWPEDEGEFNGGISVEDGVILIIMLGKEK